MKNNNPTRTSNIQLYILGLLYFDDDTQKTIVLSRKQIASIGWIFASSIFGDSKPDAGDDDTYFKFQLSKDNNPVAFRNFIGEGLANIVQEIQFGYYHHRAIFRLSFHQGTKLHVIRNARTDAYRLIREKCFDQFSDCNIGGSDRPSINEPPIHILHIYSYSLVVVPDGHKIVEEEQDKIRRQGYDDIFTIRSTTFGLYLSEQGSLFNPKKHYLRISVPSIMIYLKGKSLRNSLFDNIVDAIYYGGLYQKVILDKKRADETNSKFVASDIWTNDLLLSVLRILNDSVNANETNDISVHLERFALIAGIAAIIVSIILSFILQ